MSGDVVERAEKFVALDHRVTKFVGSVPIINELIAEVKQLRWQVRHGDTDHLSDSDRTKGEQ